MTPSSCHPDKPNVGGGKCKTCYFREYMRTYDKTPKAMNTRFLRMYNITYHDYMHMQNVQDGKCAICENESVKERLSVDHCHTTGKVRGLLCRSCNRALGIIGDANMGRAAAYLGSAA